MSEPSSNSWLPLVLAAAVGAGLSGASSYFMSVYISKKLDDQAKQMRKVMTKELYWRMKLSEQGSSDHLHNGDLDDFLNGGPDVPRPAQRRNRLANSTSSDRRRAGGMPPTSPPLNPHLQTGTHTTPHQQPMAHHPAQPQQFRPSPGMGSQMLLPAASENPSKSVSPNNIPRFLTPMATTPDLPSININMAGGHAVLQPQGRAAFTSPQLQAAGLQDGLPIRAVSMQSARGPEDLEDEEDDILVDEVEEEELEEEARRAEEALMARQRQISESRASPRGMPGGQGFGGQGVTALHNAVTTALEGVAQVGQEVGDGKTPNNPVLHSLSMIQDNVHHPVSDPRAADILRKKPEQEDFVRVNVAPLDEPSAEDVEALKLLQQCLALRDKYLFVEAIPPWRKDRSKLPIADPKDPFRFDAQPASEHVFEMEDGVVRVYANKEAHKNQEEQFPVWDATTFFTDMHHILRITSLGPVRTLCYYRLKLLEQKFHLHLLLNADREFCAQKSAPHRDLYNVRKVDTHVHHSACMNQKHLLRFIKSKLKKEPDEVVIFRDGKFLTLKEVFESLDLSSYDLNVDLLDVHADKNTFHRFDKFNLKYNPCGQSRLREIFIKQENLIQGRFLAELTKEVFTDLVASKYQMAEYRISIYGRKKSEWDNLASWAVNNELACENVVWLIQLPRLYSVYKEMGIMSSFQVMLDNVFLPLFEVTVDPSSHPHLHVFLKHVVGFDMVDDESKPERRPTKHMPTPNEWTNQFNPAFAYYTYYVYANLYVLNKLRESKNMSIIRFRPHCGEAGDIDHLAAAFMTSHNIAHGNNLRRSPALQYLYYLKQIGLAMSPLSNNSLFLDYHKNPFPTFFARGLNVSLSTDDPLMIHLTKEPLVEEYSIAAQVWRLSSCDLCEVARNSVYQSGFCHPTKEHWVGPLYFKRGHRGNDIQCTNVPHIRMEFRHQVWRTELMYVYLGQAYVPDEVDY